jgi:membrane protein YdbS with pleckstrin-like domain
MKLRTSRILLLPIFIILLPLFFLNFLYFIVIFSFIAIFIEIYRIYRYVEIEKENIIEKVGIIKINIKKTKKDDIINIKIVQGPIARIFNYGDVIFMTYSEKIEAKYIYNPKRFLKINKF